MDGYYSLLNKIVREKMQEGQLFIDKAELTSCLDFPTWRGMNLNADAVMQCPLSCCGRTAGGHL